jgi:hypothetical protein
MPALMGTLDAIHLATALVWRDRTGRELVMATHNSGLAAAARAFGMRVLGVDTDTATDSSSSTLPD